MRKITFLFLFAFIGLSWQVNAQFTESFETEIPGSWSIINNGDPNGWEFDDAPSGGAQEGSAVAGIVYSSEAHDDYLITPGIAVTAGINDRLSYYIKSRSSSFLEPYEVLLSTTGTAAGDFTVTLQGSTEAPSSWTLDEFNLVAYTGQTIYVAIKATGTNEWELYVDNVVNDAMPACPLPTALTASEITTSSAILSWTEEGTASIYNVEVVEAGVTPTETPTDSGVANGFTKTGLSVYTEYEYYVQADCEGNGTSDWVGPYSFTTLPTPPANDECSDAVSLTVNPDYDCAVVTNGTIFGATDSGADNCGGTPDDDVWYSFVATDEVHMVSLINISGSTVDMYHAIYDGSSGCGSLGEPLECNDGNSSELDGLTPGNTYYVQVFTWTSTGGQTSVFDICVGTLPCLEGEATGTIVSDCDNTQFSIDVEVTNQEDITDLTDGTTTIEVTGEGTYTFGPYASGTTVNIEALHIDDYCDFEVDEFYFQCPEEIICGTTLSETYCYENNESVVFSYTSSDGVSPLLIEFSQGTLEYDSWWGDTFDDLVIYDGSDNSGIVLFNSDIDGDDLTGLSFQANSGSIYMEFESDGTGSCGEGTETSWAYDISCVSCVPADVIAGVVPNCDSDEFFVEIGIATVDDFGDLVTLTDGAGQSETVSTSQPLYIFGPYPNGTEVTITAEHSDAACDFEVGTWEYYCPPANDACDGAEMLTVGPSIDAYPVDGTVLGATEDAEPNDCGLNGPGVWYAVVVPANGSVNIETATDSNGTTGFDSVIEAFSGSCGSLTSIDCDDDGAATGNYSLLELNDLTPGETIYVRVWEYGGNETEPFSISAYNETLSTQDFDTQELFSYFPNPVENSLTIKAQQAIELVEVYNMLGQMVANETPNNMEGTIDMSTLTAGAYFVKVTIGNSTETIRIVKK